jgi:hypothetical protein
MRRQSAQAGPARSSTARLAWMHCVPGGDRVKGRRPPVAAALGPPATRSPPRTDQHPGDQGNRAISLDNHSRSLRISAGGWHFCQRRGNAGPPSVGRPPRSGHDQQDHVRGLSSVCVRAWYQRFRHLAWHRSDFCHAPQASLKLSRKTTGSSDA